jgi:hypothetical protein
MRPRKFEGRQLPSQVPEPESSGDWLLFTEDMSGARLREV